MRYISGIDALPEDLLNEIKRYVDGVYVYIPKSDSKKRKWGENTKYHHEMKLRNLHIYEKHLEGIPSVELAKIYHLSPKSIGRIILSQRREMESVASMIKEIVKQWGIEACPKQIYHSAWSIGEDYVLKEYSDQKALARNLEMLKVLHREGVPVPQLCPLKNGNEFYTLNDKMYMLTTKLKGSNIIDIDGCDKAWFYDFGKILARLHLAFRECEKTMSFWSKSLLEEMNGWVTRNITQCAPEDLAKEEVSRAILELSQMYLDLPKQLIHRDVHLGNFLFEERQFSGYIDFDLSQINIRIFDLCYFLLGLLMKEDSNRVNTDRWFMIVQQVIAGYDSLVRLEQVEKDSIACVMKNIEILFVAYFLGIDDEKLAKDSADLFKFVCENEEAVALSII